MNVVGGLDMLRRRARDLPLPKRRRPQRAALSVPALALAGLAAAGALLLWDEQRRAAMRRRLEGVVTNVGTGLERVTQSRPVAPDRSVTAAGTRPE